MISIAKISLFILSFPLLAQSLAQWSYKGKTGPQNWSTIDKSFSLCSKGKMQSPINIETKHAKPEKNMLPLFLII